MGIVGEGERGPGGRGWGELTARSRTVDARRRRAAEQGRGAEGRMEETRDRREGMDDGG